VNHRRWIRPEAIRKIRIDMDGQDVAFISQILIYKDIVPDTGHATIQTGVASLQTHFSKQIT
jgi:hypothetical protein